MVCLIFIGVMDPDLHASRGFHISNTHLSLLTFLCFASIVPSGPNEMEVLYNFPSLFLSGMDPPMM